MEDGVFALHSTQVTGDVRALANMEYTWEVELVQTSRSNEMAPCTCAWIVEPRA